jgi:hypothetical protein
MIIPVDTPRMPQRRSDLRSVSTTMIFGCPQP